MNNFDESNEILKQEIELILSEIKEVYNNSDKKVTGEFENGLSGEYEPNKATIKGYLYLGGRNGGIIPPVQEIENWIINKGIQPLDELMTLNSLAWAIAKKISKEGTNPINHLNIYQEVITPQRIDTIINKLSVFNAGLFISEITNELKNLK